jgi:hypothetical protein
MATVNRLTAKQVAGLSPGFHADGANLHLEVRPDGGRQWVFGYRFGDRRDLGLSGAGSGGVTLAGARQKAEPVRAQLRASVDPQAVKQAAKAPPRRVPSFREAMDAPNRAQAPEREGGQERGPVALEPDDPRRAHPRQARRCRHDARWGRGAHPNLAHARGPSGPRGLNHKF